uniref:Uncharacterized protein n=1 Tax=viral metagenome TaxID=1070528 RepID=A0A6C0AD12_9ZZZZ
MSTTTYNLEELMNKNLLNINIKHLIYYVLFYF